MSTSTSHPSTSSPDIPFHGFVETTADALRLIQAARQGVIPRITRRLNEEERATIVRSGAVFVFSVEESGIRRWTEGLSWSASRIAGNFLVSTFSPAKIIAESRVVTTGPSSFIESWPAATAVGPVTPAKRFNQIVPSLVGKSFRKSRIRRSCSSQTGW